MNDLLKETGSLRNDCDSVFTAPILSKADVIAAHRLEIGDRNFEKWMEGEEKLKIIHASDLEGASRGR